MDIRELRDQIFYPCRWSYRVVGRDEPEIRAAVTTVLGDREHSLVISNHSRTEKYLSMALELEVQTEEERLEIFQSLKDEPRIRFVL